MSLYRIKVMMIMDTLLELTKIVGAFILMGIMLFVIHKAWEGVASLVKLIIGITGWLFCIGLIIFGIMTFPFGIILILLGILLLHVITE